MILSLYFSRKFWCDRQSINNPRLAYIASCYHALKSILYVQDIRVQSLKCIQKSNKSRINVFLPLLLSHLSSHAYIPLGSIVFLISDIYGFFRFGAPISIVLLWAKGKRGRESTHNCHRATPPRHCLLCDKVIIIWRFLFSEYLI